MSLLAYLRYGITIKRININYKLELKSINKHVVVNLNIHVLLHATPNEKTQAIKSNMNRMLSKIYT